MNHHYESYWACCNTGVLQNRCLSFAAELNQCRLRPYCCVWTLKMDTSAENSYKTALHIFHIFCTIVPIVSWLAIARIATRTWDRTRYSNKVIRFIIEFCLIVIPTVLSVNVANRFVEYYVAVTSLFLLLLIQKTGCLKRARNRYFESEQRPAIMTLTRSTIAFLTALCILAIDFESFPRVFRKSRRFGAGLMDVGIGLFAFSMGTVSRRPRRTADLKRLLRVTISLLILGLARTVTIIAIDYEQDPHEYGTHLNAFFTLGLTKLFGTLFGAVVTNDIYLLPLGLGILILHEIFLQLGVSEFVMDDDIERSTFWTSNREGLCSLPGFVGIFIISMAFGQWLQAKTILSFQEYAQKLNRLSLCSVMLWVLVVNSVFLIGIARVTCNFGYAMWIFSIAVTMTLLFMIVFDLVLDTLFPVDYQSMSSKEIGQNSLKASESKANQKIFVVPMLVEAVNYNGLLFFLLANILTGGVNIYLKPDERSAFESVVILTLYMFISTGIVCILYNFKIRIA